jgi:uncharacterized repeat protein (TIGR02543 family)
MKKIIVSLILLTIVLLPKNVLAVEKQEGINIDVDPIIITVGETKKIDIVAYKAIGDVIITSSDNSIVEVDKEDVATGMLDPDNGYDEKVLTVTLTGKSVGTAEITFVIDGSLYDKDATRIKRTDKLTITVKESKTSEKEYTVTYNANGGKNTPENQTKVDGKPLTLQDKIPIYDGYEFVGWNTKEDGSGEKYTAGSEYTEDANVTLYAQWKKKGNATSNPNTGDTIIYVVLLLTLGALIYSYWYMKKVQEN